jgi:lysine decarboxylase
MARAVFLVEPGYVGTMSDVAGHAEAAHAQGVPLVVDQAWGAHFGFHPALPPHGLQVGADALVMSAHKTLPAYTQAAFVVARTDRLDRDRLDRSFDALATTSASGTIVASADAARALLQDRGEELVASLLVVAEQARAALRAVDGVLVVDADTLPGVRIDPTKIVLSLAGAGVDGLALEELLVRSGHPVELADHDTVIPLLTLADTAAEVESFVAAFTAGVEALRGEPRDVVPSVAWSVAPDVVMPPRDAFFARHEVVEAADAVGRVSAELVAPYPPGVPVLAPGERVSEAALDGLRRALAAGTQVRYASDPTLETLQVVA